MKQFDCKAMEKAVGLKVAYNKFEDSQKLPLITYHGNGQSTFIADGKIYTKEDHYIVEYYFEKKDPKLEEKIEHYFIETGYIYTKSEDVSLDGNEAQVIYYSI